MPEKRYPQDKPPMVVALDLTKLCNNRCLYCFAYPEHMASPARVSMSYETACQVLNIVAREFRIHSVRFTGGEATLHPRLADLIHFTLSAVRPKTVVLLSNGRRLRDPNFCGSLYEAGLTSMQISLQSSDASIHDQMVGARGAWAQTVEGIRTALRLHPDGPQSNHWINVKTTISELNRHTIEETVRFLADLGVCSLSMNVCAPAGRGSEQTALVPGLGDRVQLVARAQALAQALGIYFESHMSFDLCAEDPQSVGLRHYACGRGRDYISVDYQGNLHLCDFWGRSGGNLLEAGSVRALWSTDQFMQFWYGRHLADRCRVCERRHQCGGVCPVAAEAFGCQHIYEATGDPLPVC